MLVSRLSSDFLARSLSYSVFFWLQLWAERGRKRVGKLNHR